MDKYRWDLYSGRASVNDLNCYWTKQVAEFQGQVSLILTSFDNLFYIIRYQEYIAPLSTSAGIWTHNLWYMSLLHNH